MKTLKYLMRRVLPGWLIVALLTSFWPLAPLPVAYAANTGYRNPTAQITGGPGYGDGFETNPTGAFADGGGVAQNLDGAGERHEYYNFGFTGVIPADAIITGIEVRVDGSVDQAANGARYDVDLTWNVAASFTAPQSTPALAAAETTSVLGGPNDLWGRTWTVSELAEEIFAVRITSVASSAQRDFFLDYVTVRVYYASARLSGVVFSDDNSNGVQNGGEAGLNNVPLTFFRDDGDGNFEGGGQDVQVGTATTNETGVYTSTPFLDGFSYWVDVTAPLSRTLTTPPEPRLVPIPTGANVTGINFGYAPLPGTNPAIDIAKTPDAQTIVSGSTVTFTIAYTNTGNVTLSNVLITDTLAPNCGRTVGTLSSGQAQSYTCTLANVSADFTNLAQIGGVYTATSTSAIDSDTAAVDVINPALAVSKSPDLQSILSGGTANFTIVVTNTGDVALTSVGVSDALAPACSQSLGTLTAGQSQSYACALTNVTADLTNIALAFGATPLGAAITATDTALVDVVGPAITLEKSPDLQLVGVGGTVTFTISVTNTGDSTLSNVTVADPLAANCDRNLGTLTVGQGQTYTCALPNFTSAFTNTATVSCTGPTGVITDSDTAVVRVNPFPNCPNGMTALYRLNESSAGSYADQYGGPTGACNGVCPAPRTGRVGGAQEFNGTQTGVTVPAAGGAAAFDWATGSSFSVEVWMRANPANSCTRDSAEVIVGRGSTPSIMQWWLGVACFTPAQRGRAAFFLRDVAGNSGIVIGTRLIADGAWHHLTAIRNAATGEMQLYVDGQLDGTLLQGFGAGFASASEPLRIGWLPLDVNFRYDGLVDELAFYNRTLTGGEILAHVGAGQLGRSYCELNLPLLYLPLIARAP